MGGGSSAAHKQKPASPSPLAVDLEVTSNTAFGLGALVGGGGSGSVAPA